MTIANQIRDEYFHQIEKKGVPFEIIHYQKGRLSQKYNSNPYLKHSFEWVQFNLGVKHALDIVPENLTNDDFLGREFSFENELTILYINKNVCDLIFESDWMSWDKEDTNYAIAVCEEQYKFFEYLYDRGMYEYAVKYACQDNWDNYFPYNYDELYSNF